MEILERTHTQDKIPSQTIVEVQENALSAKYAFFAEVFMPLQQSVGNYALHLSRNQANADDLAQDTFLKAFDKMHQFTPGTNAKAWIFRICYNSFVNKYRKEQSRPITTELEEERTTDDDVVDVLSQYATELNPDFGSYGDEVQAALNKLKDKHREIIFLWLEDVPYEEIGEILEIEALGTVRSRINRARKNLLAELADYAKSQGFSNAK